MERAFDQIPSVLELSLISLHGSFFLNRSGFFPPSYFIRQFLINFLLSPCRTLNMKSFFTGMIWNKDLGEQLCQVRFLGARGGILTQPGAQAAAALSLLPLLDALTGCSGDSQPFQLPEVFRPLLCTCAAFIFYFIFVNLLIFQPVVLSLKSRMWFCPIFGCYPHPCLLLFQPTSAPEVQEHPERHRDQAGVWLPWKQPGISDQLKLGKSAITSVD